MTGHNYWFEVVGLVGACLTTFSFLPQVLLFVGQALVSDSTLDYVRSRNAFSQMGAGFKSLVGGELKGMTSNLVNSRNEVMGRMIDEARNRGANAVVAMRFDTSEMGDTWTEICAYGTAVRTRKL